MINRNVSLSLPSNSSTISDVEWVINGITIIIFLLAFLGNTAALIVMFGSRGPIRLTNNRYLMNLACADLLRACFMPFTIIARMKRNFIFGRIICQILPIVQGEMSFDSSTMRRAPSRIEFEQKKGTRKQMIFSEFSGGISSREILLWALTFILLRLPCRIIISKIFRCSSKRI